MLSKCSWLTCVPCAAPPNPYGTYSDGGIGIMVACPGLPPPTEPEDGIGKNKLSSSSSSPIIVLLPGNQPLPLPLPLP